ncbi:uncharacterized protein NDAI_0H03740 [Naumovozyma dairenensis CBS 421]|uniref:non-specific serine/threonine protein kinase n=1 Tax=Naumovozyma dairenensis (strain ATCC 10597 / BCRC 20456 / CBS 421 / NBRC 0211 / NRRL Y-12639) TaxID=1071378 RepID=G0WFI6_NAUDC|nr:hypothetical protein NDAI_0H03740 [Naumovozyma dairenensis CBS 421]CCD26547.1 hypothetical protein NDAI_0H03740 [Naumovozyma dairenensis CBS 421]
MQTLSPGNPPVPSYIEATVGHSITGNNNNNNNNHHHYSQNSTNNPLPDIYVQTAITNEGELEVYPLYSNDYCNQLINDNHASDNVSGSSLRTLSTNNSTATSSNNNFTGLQQDHHHEGSQDVNEQRQLMQLWDSHTDISDRHSTSVSSDSPMDLSHLTETRMGTHGTIIRSTNGTNGRETRLFSPNHLGLPSYAESMVVRTKTISSNGSSAITTDHNTERQDGRDRTIDESIMNEKKNKKKNKEKRNDKKNIPPLACIIPYSIPNSKNNNDAYNNKQENNNNKNGRSAMMILTRTGSLSASNGNNNSILPNNVSTIDSNVISSPIVDSVEPRFIVSLDKFQNSNFFHEQLCVKEEEEEKKEVDRERVLKNKTKNSKDNKKRTKSLSSHIGNLFSFNSNSNTNNTIQKKERRHSSYHFYSRRKSSTRRRKNSTSNVSGNGGGMQHSILVSDDNSSDDIETMIAKEEERQNNPYGNKSTNLESLKPSKISKIHHGFHKKYIEINELGSGASGSVKLIQRKNDDSVVYAMKQFRKRVISKETKRDYIRTITSEYCIGINLNHPNIIKTLELIYENDDKTDCSNELRICQIMEYCSYDLFAITMSDYATYDEICCYFKQLMNGVNYLHSIGLCHRDLKLENCVINDYGILKIIDFGAAVVFQYPCSMNLIEASGILGSDPYLPPEVYHFTHYDPRPVDIWSCAIIFVCMVLKKFPWKIPKLTDESFKMFCMGRESNSLIELLTKPNLRVKNKKNGSSSLSNDSDTSSVELESYIEDETYSIDDNNVHIGKLRVLHAIPEECQPMIGKMLELAPTRRATLREILEDSWIETIDMCHLLNEEEIEECKFNDLNDKDGDMKYKFIYVGESHNHTKVQPEKAHINGFLRKDEKEQNTKEEEDDAIQEEGEQYEGSDVEVHSLYSFSSY